MTTHLPPKRRWTDLDALTVLRPLSAWLSGKGWLAGLYGSVLTQGMSDNDLDVLLVPSWPRPRVTVDDIVRWFTQEGWTERDRHRGETSLAVAMERKGYYVDLRFSVAPDPHALPAEVLMTCWACRGSCMDPDGVRSCDFCNGRGKIGRGVRV